MKVAVFAVMVMGLPVYEIAGNDGVVRTYYGVEVGDKEGNKARFSVPSEIVSGLEWGRVYDMQVTLSTDQKGRLKGKVDTYEQAV